MSLTDPPPLENALWVINDWIELMEDCGRGEPTDGQWAKRWAKKLADARATAAWLEEMMRIIHPYVPPPPKPAKRRSGRQLYRDLQQCKAKKT